MVTVLSAMRGRPTFLVGGFVMAGIVLCHERSLTRACFVAQNRGMDTSIQGRLCDAKAKHLQEPVKPRHEFDDDAVCIHCGFDGAEWHHWKHWTHEGKAHPEAKPPLCTRSRGA